MGTRVQWKGKNAPLANTSRLCSTAFEGSRGEKRKTDRDLVSSRDFSDRQRPEPYLLRSICIR